MNELTIGLDSPQARGQRLRKLRKMMALTAEELGKLLGYARQTISYWERAGKEGGLSEKAALKCVEIAASRGITCDYKWLMYGIGEAQIAPLQAQIPARHNSVLMKPMDEDSRKEWMRESINELQQNIRFYKEIEAFFQEDETAVITIIKNSCMEPVYQKNDWGGGHLVNIDKDLDGKICIVDMGEPLQVRLVKLGDIENKFHISYLKDEETSSDFELKNVDIKRAALIKRTWRK